MRTGELYPSSDVINYYRKIIVNELEASSQEELQNYLDQYIFLIRRNDFEPIEAYMDIFELFDEDRARMKSEEKHTDPIPSESSRLTGEPVLRLMKFDAS